MISQTVVQNQLLVKMALVEHVVNASVYKCTFIVDNVQAYIILDGVQGWGTDCNYNFITSDDQYKLPFKYLQSKKVAEFVVLSKELGVRIVGKDNSGNLIGQLY